MFWSWVNRLKYAGFLYDGRLDWVIPENCARMWNLDINCITTKKMIEDDHVLEIGMTYIKNSAITIILTKLFFNLLVPGVPQKVIFTQITRHLKAAGLSK